MKRILFSGLLCFFMGFPLLGALGSQQEPFLLEVTNREVGLETATSVASFSGLTNGFFASVNKHKVLSVSSFDYLTKFFTDTVGTRGNVSEFAFLPRMAWVESDEGKKYLAVTDEQEIIVYLFDARKKFLAKIGSIATQEAAAAISACNINGQLFLAVAYVGTAPSGLYHITDDEKIEFVADVSSVKNLANRVVSYADEHHSSILLKEESGIAYMVLASAEKGEPVRILTFDPEKTIQFKEIAHTKKVDGIYPEKPVDNSKDPVWSLDLFMGPDRKLYLVTGGGLYQKRVSPTKIYRLDQDKNKTSLVLVVQAEPCTDTLYDLTVRESVSMVTIGTLVYCAVGHDRGGVHDATFGLNQSLNMYEFGYTNDGSLKKIACSDRVANVVGVWGSYAADSITSLSWVQQPGAPGNVTLLTGMIETDQDALQDTFPASSRLYRLVSVPLLIKTYVDDAASIFSLLLDRRQIKDATRLFIGLMQERMAYAVDILQELALDEATTLVKALPAYDEDNVVSEADRQLLDRLMYERAAHMQRQQMVHSAVLVSPGNLPGSMQAEIPLLQKFSRFRARARRNRPIAQDVPCQREVCYKASDCIHDSGVLVLVDLVVAMAAGDYDQCSFLSPERIAYKIFCTLFHDQTYLVDQVACLFSILFDARFQLWALYEYQYDQQALEFILDNLQSFASATLSAFVKLLCMQRDQRTLLVACGLDGSDYTVVQLDPGEFAAQLLLSIGLLERLNINACCDQFPKALRMMFEGVDFCSCTFTCLVDIFARVLELLAQDIVCGQKNTFCTALLCLSKRYDVMAALFDKVISMGFISCPFDLIVNIAERNSKDSLKILAFMADEFGCSSSLTLIQELWSHHIIYV